MTSRAAAVADRAVRMFRPLVRKTEETLVCSPQVRTVSQRSALVRMAYPLGKPGVHVLGGCVLYLNIYYICTV